MPTGAWRRRGRNAVIALVALYAVLEAGAWLGFLLLDGRPFSFERIASERAGALVEPALPDPFLRVAPQRSGPFVEVIHPYLGFVLDLCASDRSVERSAPMLRIEECDLDRPRRSPDTLLVGLFGGSAAFAFSEEGAATLARALEGCATFAGRRVTFVVAAAYGWRQPQQVMALTWLVALGGELDLLIDLDGLEGVLRAGVDDGGPESFPSYPRRWPERVGRPADPATRFVLGRWSIATGDRVDWAKAMDAGPTHWSIAANLLWRGRDRGLQRDVEEVTRELIEAPSTGESYVMRGPPYDASDPSRTLDDLVAVWKRSCRLMDEICRSRAIRCFHFLQPNPFVESSKPLSPEERETCRRAGSDVEAAVVAGWPKLQAAGRELAATGEVFVDLTMVFAGVDRTLYVDADGRLDRDGNDLLATRIAESIERELGAR